MKLSSSAGNDNDNNGNDNNNNNNNNDEEEDLNQSQFFDIDTIGNNNNNNDPVIIRRGDGNLDGLDNKIFEDIETGQPPQWMVMKEVCLLFFVFFCVMFLYER